MGEALKSLAGLDARDSMALHDAMQPPQLVPVTKGGDCILKKVRP